MRVSDPLARPCTTNLPFTRRTAVSPPEVGYGAKSANAPNESPSAVCSDGFPQSPFAIRTVPRGETTPKSAVVVGGFTA